MSFDQLGLSAALLRAVQELGYTTPTPIQQGAIPAVRDGRDLLAAAQTGTGKTAAFALPLLQRLDEELPNPRGPRAPRLLVLVPTRELAAQVSQSFDDFGRHLRQRSVLIFGGVSPRPQMDALRQGVDIIVATPGRLLDHINERVVDLSKIRFLVLDEADRMLDMGFIRDIRRVLAVLPKQRQNLLFSATFSDEIRTLANGLLHNPLTVEVAARNAPAELIEHRVHLVEQGDKRSVLSHLLREGATPQTLVFTRTKHGANRLAEQLERDGIQCAAIHGNKSQSARTRALADFKDYKVQVLVATDIAARGLDISELPQVVNYELPHVPEDYVHRIGRTGRAGSAGQALSLVSSDEKDRLRAIERVLGRKINVLPLDRSGIRFQQDAPPRAAAQPASRAPRPAHGGGGYRGQGRPQRGMHRR
ncbi:MAG: DEAD/DEAH box helicase [Steroidobacteraceae bacterium]